MNVYDFDKTIYKKDSSIRFYLYCLRKYPKTIQALPQQVRGLFKYILGHLSKTEFKECFFSFLSFLPDVKSIVEDFWKIHKLNIEKWFLQRKLSGDVVISASPEFLLKPICQFLNVELLATRMDAQTGKIHGLNCHGTEKLTRFKERYGTVRIANFYSDSLTDAPLANQADSAFLVGKGSIIQWPKT